MGQSWSAIRGKLENDFLCENLRGRVQYFFTIYHGTQDNDGRFAIRFDGQEVFQANSYNYNHYYTISKALKEQESVPRREWNGKEMLFDEENSSIEELAAIQSINSGIADSFDVMRFIDEFLNQPIEKSLNSDNYLLRMLAILDRRVGKRTFSKLIDDYSYLPDWLKQFYELRFKVEGFNSDNRS